MASSRTLRIVQKHTRIGDPHVTSDDVDRLSILHAIFEPLIRRESGGTYRPCLAERWSLSDDARTWTFLLREDVVFHDGKPFEAGDVVTSLARIRDENVGGELGTTGVFQSYLAGSTIEAVGAHTVRLTTPDSTADLLDLLVDIPILSKAGIERLPEVFVGTGPYEFKAHDADRVLLTRHPWYWAKGERPLVIEWLSVPDPQDRLARLLAGRADGAGALPPFARDVLDAASEFRTVRAQTSVCATFMGNLFEGICTHRAVRQALNYALHIPDLIRTVAHDAALPLTGPLTALHLGFDPATPGFAYDPKRARALLDEAGYGPTLALTLDVPTTLPDEALDLAEKMAEYYSDVGIETRIITHRDRPAYAERVRAKQIHDAACFDSSPFSTFRVFREKFHSGLRGPWWLGYDNPRVNHLIDTARATVAVPERQRLYRQAYALLSKDAPWIFLYNPLRYLGIRRDLGAWQPSPEGYWAFS